MSDGDYRFVLEVLTAGLSGGSRHYLRVGRHTIGSADGCDPHVPHDGVSRRHAELEVLENGGAVLRDLGSTNGTTLDGRAIRRAAVTGSVTVGLGPVEASLREVATSIAIRGDQDGSKHDGPSAATTVADPGIVSALADELAAAVGDPEPSGSRGSSLAAAWARGLSASVEILTETDGETCVLARSGAPLIAPPPVAGGDSEAPSHPASASARSEFVLDDLRLVLAATTPLSRRELAPLARFTLKRVALRRRASSSVSAVPAAELPGPGSSDPAVLALHRDCARIARGDIPILIRGESGSGKEVLARWIHGCSARRDGPFLALNCAAVPRDLLEAELFGIHRGVATGVDARPGVLERASGGTLLLDEIGDMPPELQAKLLRAIEEDAVHRVGGRQLVPVDVRYLAATHRDLELSIRDGAFRLDLYHRLAAFEVELPALRQRRADIPSFVIHFFGESRERRDLKSPGVTRRALAALVAHEWPGNLRELRHEIERATLLLDSGEPLDLVHLSPRVRGASADGDAGGGLRLEDAMQRAEREALAVALGASRGDPASAWELLGISKSSFYRKLRQHDLDD